MKRAMLSFIISCEYDRRSDTTKVRVVQVDTGENVRIHEGGFLLRCSLNGRGSIQRYQVRHIASGREAHFQAGPGLRDFIKDCLLDTGESSDHA